MNDTEKAAVLKRIAEYLDDSYEVEISIDRPPLAVKPSWHNGNVVEFRPGPVAIVTVTIRTVPATASAT